MRPDMSGSISCDVRSREDRSFAGKAHAVNAALERMRSTEFDVVGNLDADITFEPDYMAFLMEKFAQDPQLGVAGTPLTEDGGYDSSKDSFEGEKLGDGPLSAFSICVFQDIGGYVANRAGGVDWIAVMTARMRGWKVRSFPEKRYHHHRSMGLSSTMIDKVSDVFRSLPFYFQQENESGSASARHSIATTFPFFPSAATGENVISEP